MRATLVPSLVLLSLVACGPKSPEQATDTADDTRGDTSVATDATGGSPTTTTATSGLPPGSTVTTAHPHDLPDTGGGGSGCEETGGCNRLDLLFVVDNSADMADEQAHLVAALPHLVKRLRDMVGVDGVPVEPDVHLMVTTTDMGHPNCDPFTKADYEPAKGAPITTACVDRLERFTGLGANPEMRPEVCLDRCPAEEHAIPVDPFLHFHGELNNVIPGDTADPVLAALECIVPQGIDGCGFEATLESMIQALDPNKPWNQGAAPFMRPAAALGIVILTSETDCSPKDLRHFDPKNVDDPEFNQFWEDSPGLPGVKDEPTSAVCWNASMTCEDGDVDGVYESCVPEEKGVLQPLSRYSGWLIDQLREQRGSPVFMLVITGIPDTGIGDLVHRGWTQDDILPGDGDAPEQKEFEFGIGPGCTGGASGNALPPGRIRQLCEELDVADDPNTPADESATRCCFESACATDLAGGFDCLLDAMAQELRAAP
ncbi:hypothetical protein [Nannocystis sp. SCPEA4]|uniref:hypothetical protein n=1 Tax=Nannocystis sp. SCPEA4 TaxID=2996787 RepID=UPI00226FCA87|nr:hypothetical protein [Nannocystis sp. SCPEA4]MCY1058475.1 hypothetical protein [Nannocystis sp. SCPEA4]